jgi:hypothetical protein
MARNLRAAIEEILQNNDFSILQVTKRLGNRWSCETIGRELKKMYDEEILSRKTAPRPYKDGTWREETESKPWVFIYSTKKR